MCELNSAPLLMANIQYMHMSYVRSAASNDMKLY